MVFLILFIFTVPLAVASSGFLIHCQEQCYDGYSNCTNPLTRSQNDSCGLIEFRTMLTFKGASGPTIREEYVELAHASETFCASAENPNFILSVQIDECHPEIPEVIHLANDNQLKNDKLFDV